METIHSLLDKFGFYYVLRILLVLLVVCATTHAKSDSKKSKEITSKKPPFSVAGFGDSSYRETNFYREDQNTIVTNIDFRGEFWFPPGRNLFSWGPYVRLAWVSSSEKEAFANAYTALPGGGLQIYPFSFDDNSESWRSIKNLLGPLRLFAEYNRVHFRGEENQWRPDSQIRAGVEYWRSRYANDTFVAIWHEFWGGVIWQSTNEFDDKYDTLVSAGSFRIGSRWPNGTLISQFTPYLVADVIKTKNEDYYWENRFTVGGGLRWAPPKFWFEKLGVQRFVVFGEYLWVVDYLEVDAPSTVPDHDFRAGISFSIGEWFR